MEERIVDQDIVLIPYYPNDAVTLAWYQDPDVCKQVDNMDHVYTPELISEQAHRAAVYFKYDWSRGRKGHG